MVPAIELSLSRDTNQCVCDITTQQAPVTHALMTSSVRHRSPISGPPRVPHLGVGFGRWTPHLGVGFGRWISHLGVGFGRQTLTWVLGLGGGSLTWVLGLGGGSLTWVLGLGGGSLTWVLGLGGGGRSPIHDNFSGSGASMCTQSSRTCRGSCVGGRCACARPE